jgi:hypothetical protein
LIFGPNWRRRTDGAFKIRKFVSLAYVRDHKTPPLIFAKNSLVYRRVVSSTLDSMSDRPPTSDTETAQKKQQLRALRRNDAPRQANLSGLDKGRRDPAVAQMLDAARALSVAHMSAFLSVRIFDSAFAVRHAEYNPSLMAAASLVLAVKVWEPKRSVSLCSDVSALFALLTLDDIVNEELEVFVLIEFNAIFATSFQFMNFFSERKNDAILKLATSLCFCAARRFECSFYTAEEVGCECLAIAEELLGNGLQIDAVNPSNSSKLEIVIAVKERPELLGPSP